MKGLLPTAILSAAIALTSSRVANAWESQCHQTSAPVGPLTFQNAVCQPFLEYKDNRCQTSLGQARGRHLGEHAFITSEAMRALGVPTPLLETRALDSYPGSALNLPGTAFTSRAPVTIASGRAWVTNLMTIPEFSQVPDASFGLADFLLGNEQCFMPGLQRDGLLVGESQDLKPTPDTIQVAERCHSFPHHMGPANSTHFPPQARAVYALYHQSALDIGERCRLMAELGARHIAREYIFTKAVPQCEREALVFEAIASHYLADAWSTGHMWERWGSPLLPIDQLALKKTQITASISGMIHGWRSVIRDIPGLEDSPIQHDELNLPLSLWRPNAHTSPLGGGGDLYLLPCSPQPTPFAVWDAPELEMQKRMLLTCVARGFEEVYRNGPQTHGPLGKPSSLLIKSITDPLSDQCWEQRATNDSMLLGLMPPRTLHNIFDPSDLTAPLLMYLYPVELISDTSSRFESASIVDQTRYDLQSLYFDWLIRATSRPDDADAARDPLSFLDVPKNSAGVPIISAGNVPYLEKSLASDHPKAWTEIMSERACASTADCLPNEYCETLAYDNSAHCLAKEAAIMSAFRAAETPAWCGPTRTSIEAPDATMWSAREACIAERSAPACARCEEILSTQLRSACYRPVSHDALCDIFEEHGIASKGANRYFSSFDPTSPAALKRAAADACNGSSLLVPSEFESALANDEFKTHPIHGITDGGTGEYDANGGAGPKVICDGIIARWRITDGAALPSRHLHRIVLAEINSLSSDAPDLSSKILIRTFSGADCQTPIDLPWTNFGASIAADWQFTADSYLCIEVLGTEKAFATVEPQIKACQPCPEGTAVDPATCACHTPGHAICGGWFVSSDDGKSCICPTECEAPRTLNLLTCQCVCESGEYVAPSQAPAACLPACPSGMYHDEFSGNCRCATIAADGSPRCNWELEYMDDATCGCIAYPPAAQCGPDEMVCTDECGDRYCPQRCVEGCPPGQSAIPWDACDHDCRCRDNQRRAGANEIQAEFWLHSSDGFYKGLRVRYRVKKIPDNSDELQKERRRFSVVPSGTTERGTPLYRLLMDGYGCIGNCSDSDPDLAGYLKDEGDADIFAGFDAFNLSPRCITQTARELCRGGVPRGNECQEPIRDSFELLDLTMREPFE